MLAPNNPAMVVGFRATRLGGVHLVVGFIGDRLVALREDLGFNDPRGSTGVQRALRSSPIWIHRPDVEQRVAENVIQARQEVVPQIVCRPRVVKVRLDGYTV